MAVLANTGTLTAAHEVWLVAAMVKKNKKDHSAVPFGMYAKDNSNAAWTHLD